MDDKKILQYELLKQKAIGNCALQENDEQTRIDIIENLMSNMDKRWQQMFEIAQKKYNSDMQQRIMELESENSYLKKKCDRMRSVLKQSVPMHTILYLVANMGIIAVAMVLLVLCYTMHIYVFDPYYLICALLISITLFSTALKSLFDWRTMLSECTKEK